jgi:hypothetical protein
VGSGVGVNGIGVSVGGMLVEVGTDTGVEQDVSKEKSRIWIVSSERVGGRRMGCIVNENPPACLREGPGVSLRLLF